MKYWLSISVKELRSYGPDKVDGQTQRDGQGDSYIFPQTVFAGEGGGINRTNTICSQSFDIRA